MLRDNVDTIGLAAGKVGTYGGGASALIFGLSASEFAALVGAVVAIAGLVVQWYFNRRRDRREQAERDERRAEHQARMAALQAARHGE